MIEGIIEAADLPEEEKVYLKKDNFFNEWRVVNPNKKWYQMNKKDWFWLLFVAILSRMFYLGVNEIIAVSVQEAIKNCTAIIIK